MDNITFKATISRNIIFKTLLLKGEAGNNIVSIEKTGAQGLVDTYTITLTDGTTTTFQVTNGSGIQSIVNTSTSGLIDTYTITYQNGETSFFTVTNGRSIVDIEKTSTVGVLDTYTISYNDNTTSTFTIKNGMDYTVPTNGVIMYDGNDTPEGYEDYAGTFGSGHTLENQSGTDLPQQPNMQFVDAQLANDATNERTTVEVVKQVSAQQLQSAPDGLYLIPDDGSGAVLDAEDVGFTPPTGMSANNVQDAIEEIGPKTLATVTTDGVKTYAQLFDLLKTAFQGLTSAERFRCMLVFEAGVYYCAQYSDNPAFGNTETSGGNMYAQSVEFKSTGATYTYVEIRPDRSVIFVDASSYIPPSGRDFSLILA